MKEVGKSSSDRGRLTVIKCVGPRTEEVHTIVTMTEVCIGGVGRGS